MIIHDIPQRSEEWLTLRAGKFTASGAGDALSFLKGGGESARRRDYRFQLAAERLSGRPCGSDYRNADMDRGIELEAAALLAYEAQTGSLITACGFISHDEHPAGYSPDGLVDHDGLVEVKAPRIANHVGTIEAGAVPADYVPQLRHALWITGRDWIDFCSYCPAVPGLELFVVRAYASDLDLSGYASDAMRFLGDVEETYGRLRRLQERGVTYGV